MVGANSSGSPLDTLAETVSKGTIKAFEILGNETRLAILLALWEAKEPGPPLSEPSEPAVTFSELRERVGMRDSGQFNYHLDKVVGPFVEETEEGYTLTPRTEQILSAVMAGTLAEGTSFEGEPIDAECFHCGGSVVIDYSESILIERCTNCPGTYQQSDWPPGTLRTVYRPPVGLVSRTPQEMHRNGNTWDRNRTDSMLEGACPGCSGSVSSTLHVCEDHEAEEGSVCDHCGSVRELSWFHVCEVCKLEYVTASTAPIWTEMGVWAFCYDHGVDVAELHDEAGWGELRGMFADTSVISEDPMELRVTIELDGDRLEVVLDDKGRVVDMTEEATDTA